MMRIGHGYDVHKLVENRPLILGGIHIPHHLGLDGHSDADVLTHVIMDAMLGAVCEGSIGDHFPDTDPNFKDADSTKLLIEVNKIITEKHGYKINNIDCTIIAQQPKISPHSLRIRENICRILNIQLNQLSVKATTTEKLGFEGRQEGISAHCVVLLTN